MEKLVLASKSIYIPLYQAIFPNLSTKTRSEAKLFIQKIRIPIAISGLLITLIIFFGAKTVLTIVFNDDLITSYSKVFQILGLITLFSSLNMLYVTLFFPSIKEYKVRMTILVSGGIFNLCLSLITVQYFNIFGVSISVVLSELFILLLALYFYRLKTK
jgi:PST family polysaccharide transporter